jgi:hypothetical protein
VQSWPLPEDVRQQLNTQLAAAAAGTLPDDQTVGHAAVAVPAAAGC